MLKLVRDMWSKGFFHLLSTNILLNLVGLGSQLFVANRLTAIDLGRIKTMQSFISVAVILAGFGLNSSVLKLCSEKVDIEKKRNILAVNLKYSIAFSFFTVCVMYVFAKLGLYSPDPMINFWMFWFVLTVPMSVLISLFIAYLQALKQFKTMSLVQSVIRIAGVALIILFTYLWDLKGFILSNILIGIIAMIPFAGLIQPHKLLRATPSGSGRQSLVFGAWSVLANAFNALGNAIGIFILNYYVSDRSIMGDYGLASVVFVALCQITGTIQAVATPYLSQKSSDETEFKRVMRKYQKMVVWSSAAFSILVIILIPSFIHFLYGNKYELAGRFVQILTMRYFFWSCYALNNVAILGMGKMKDNFIISAAKVIVDIALSVLLIKSFNYMGAAYAQATGGALAMILVLIYYKRLARIHFRELKGKSK